jgi:ribonucleoside-triphosphate reductase
MAKAMLDKAGIAYTVIDAEDEKEKTVEFGIKKAPTLLVPNGNGYDVYDNASKIKGFIEANK